MTPSCKRNKGVKPFILTSNIFLTTHPKTHLYTKIKRVHTVKTQYVIHIQILINGLVQGVDDMVKCKGDYYIFSVSTSNNDSKTLRQKLNF